MGRNFLLHVVAMSIETEGAFTVVPEHQWKTTKTLIGGSFSSSIQLVGSDLALFELFYAMSPLKKK